MGSITQPSHDCNVDILIIGGGLSGCYTLNSLRTLKPTPSIKLIEAGGNFGGTWYYNKYPGARVDSEWPMYQLSIPEVWKDWNWQDRFPDHHQLRAYMKHMDQVLDLRRDTIFNTVIDNMTWDPSRSKWDTRTQDGKTFTSKHVVLCTGSSYKRHFPNIKGLQSFKGTLLHSAAFPEGDLDVTGKRVGVIGSGASGVQIMQELAKQDCQLTNFIRTPNQALPMRQRKIPLEEETKRKLGYEKLFKSLRNTRGGLSDPPNTVPFHGSTNEQRDSILQNAWDAGGFAYYGSTFGEFWFDKEANNYTYNFWAERVRARISDPVKREIMAPLPQQDFFGTKRCSLEQDYYESLDRPNVTIVSVKDNPITEVTETGVQTADGTLYEVDVLICATGFDALNGSQIALNLHDKHGTSLREKWSQGTLTHLGIMIPDTPNAFMVYGPQAPTAIGNAPPIIETTADWIHDVLQRMNDEDIETLEPKLEPARAWGKDIQDTNDLTFNAQTDSWWMGANVPGKFREQLNYFKGLDQYKIAIDEAVDGWRDFDIVKKS